MDEIHSEIAIIGAGMAGLACATRLATAGHAVRVFDKGRGPGGRMAARRADIAGESVSMDHGAQFFTARDEGFRAQVQDWESEGAVARWAAASKSQDDPAWVGTPGMNGPIRAMAEALARKGQGVRWGKRVDALTRDGTGWQIDAGDEVFTARTVLVAIPAEQASVLLADIAPTLASVAGSVTSQPCWAVMAAFAQRLELASDTLHDPDAAISWAARNSAKPGRGGTECWVIHARPDRSREIIDLPKEDAAKTLLRDFAAQTGVTLPDPIHLVAHRWLYALPEKLTGEPARYDAEARIGIAGDYLHSPRVEGAWLSGTALAQKALAK